MNENIENNDWVNDAPTLAAMAKRNPFSVPNGYFENGEEDIFNSIFLDGLKQNIKNNNYEVPENYFEELSDRIVTNIKLSEIIKVDQSFAVPNNYFDTLQNKITDKIAASESKKKAKVISLWGKNLVKYASAACFLLVASFGIYSYQNNNNTTIHLSETRIADLASEQLLYDIDESTIIEHIEAQQTTTSKTVSASDTEMENYILSNFSSSDLSHELNN
ncbi:hypothetical protein [Pedobacter mucosus]|uniref:hypothetical protein n=1 Tax=Pedobacter mucosus TaxID=2895286 RepID=UPI001EE3F497|nr:hypothetical protein [Pedobacter mucosus]UKT62523.1 hypothetical protein LOK61_12220 [Pedobacter mucosus]